MYCIGGGNEEGLKMENFVFTNREYLFYSIYSAAISYLAKLAMNETLRYL